MPLCSFVPPSGSATVSVHTLALVQNQFSAMQAPSAVLRTR
jgi:hypothetical protein